MFKNSKITLGIPYRTKRDEEIRGWCNTKILNQDGYKIFIFRSEDGSWTNVSLTSTLDAPSLTAPPLYTVEKAYDVLNACPAVASVSIVDDNNNPLTLEQVRAIESSRSTIRRRRRVMTTTSSRRPSSN